MAENDLGAAPPPPTSSESGSADLVSLEETSKQLDSGAGASSGDTILNAAEMFQAQLEQMTAWKHQLAQQMELMRRDGIKLLERQKALSIEKKRAGEEREALAAERSKIQQFQQQIETEAKEIARRTSELEASQAQLKQLQSDRGRWERELAEAKSEAESLATQKALTQSELAAAEVRLSEIRAIESRRDELKKQVTEAETKLTQLETERRSLDAARRDLAQQQAELAARQKASAEQESRCLAEDVRLREGLEQLENQRRSLADAQRQTDQNREAIATQQQQIAAREEALSQQTQDLAQREQAVKSSRLEIEQAQTTIQTQQAELARRVETVSNKAREVETELQSRLAEAEKLRQQAADERQAALKQRQDLQRKLEALDQDQAEQLEALAKQTKRLSERRSEVEAAERDLEKALEDRIAKATQAMQGELAELKQAHECRIAEFEQKIGQAQASAKELNDAEQRLNAQLTETQGELTHVREELTAAAASLAQSKQESSDQAKDFARQIEASREEARKLQAEIESARSQSAGGDEALKQASASAAAAQSELEGFKAQLSELKKARENLEFQLELQGEESRKELEKVRQELTQELSRRDQEIAGWKERFELASKALPVKSEGLKGKAADLARQLATMEQQRNELAKELFSVQDALRKYQEESLLAKNALEARVQTAEQKAALLETEKTTWKAIRAKAAPASGPEAERAAQRAQEHREKLLRQARGVRSFRQKMLELKAAMEVGRGEIAQQREQMRARRENLEQVKRLLEKQEMVMARKLADHNAIKTVAAVGIFVIMVLGGAFFGVYHFVHPVYRSEATVKLAPPPQMQGVELDGWLNRQMEFMRGNEVTFAAWKILRSADEHYGMHDVREEWLNTLPKHLTMQLDSGSKTLAIQYTGPDAEGVSQVCNAIAMAYATPGMRESTEPNKTVGLGSQIVAKATISQNPTEDTRLMYSLCVVAGVLFVSLLLVILFRHFVARQLREIDEMADAQDLEEMRAESGDGVRPAGA